MKRKMIAKYRRRGTAVVEMAVVAPLMVLAMLGSLEVGYAFMVKQTVTLAAREGARAAALPGGAMSDVQTAVDGSMGAADLSGYTTTSNLDSLGPTDVEVWVDVSIPFSRASFTGSLLGGGNFNISAKTSMRRERVDGGGTGVEPPA